MWSSQHPKSFILKTIPKWRLLKRTEPEKYGTGLVGLAKNAWGEASEVCFGVFVGLIGCVGFYMHYQENKRTGYITNKPYKDYYTVYRPDDPRILKLREEWYKNGAPTITRSRIGTMDGLE
jgi:hypothetical protein